MPSNEFKWKHFAPTIILWCLRWYGSTPFSYANVSDMLAERGGRAKSLSGPGRQSKALKLCEN
ncbi:hypothetical protein AHYW_004399 (plasmid) [Providencia manganoxydans]